MLCMQQTVVFSDELQNEAEVLQVAAPATQNEAEVLQVAAPATQNAADVLKVLHLPATHKQPALPLPRKCN